VTVVLNGDVSESTTAPDAEDASIIETTTTKMPVRTTHMGNDVK